MGDKSALYIMCIILGQAIVYVILFQAFHFSTAAGYGLDRVLKAVPFFSYVVFMLTTVTVVSVNKLYNLAQKKRELEIREINSQHINQLNEALRGQRHDFNNHLQVVFSLVRSERYSEALKYIGDLVGEARETSELLSIESPVVAAIMTSKLHIAKAKGIEIKHDVQGQLEGGRIQSIHLSKVLSNLIDNAIEAVEGMQEADKRVSVQIYGDSSGIYIDVKNPGEIDPEVRDRLFEPGTSTKNGDNRGMGLNIVKRIVDMYKGRIDISSDPLKGVRVLVELPR